MKHQKKMKMIKQSGVKMSNCAKLSDTLKRRLKLGLFIAKFKLIKGQRILTQWVESSIFSISNVLTNLALPI